MEFTRNSYGLGITSPEIGSLKIVLKACEGTRGVVNEYVAATLAQHLKLNVPPFFLLWQNGEPMFASVFIPGELLAHIQDSDTYWQFRDDRQIRDFDRFICNPDRHDGNVLYWNDEFYIIDHERALPTSRGCFDIPAPWIAETLESIIDSLWCRFYNEFSGSEEAEYVLNDLYKTITNAFARPAPYLTVR